MLDFIDQGFCGKLMRIGRNIVSQNEILYVVQKTRVVLVLKY
jgi:hypothetical protein